MAHLVEQMAYVGDRPWHGLGATMPSDATLDQWRIAAGLDWQAIKSPAMFRDELGTIHASSQFHMLHRSDTKAALAVVSGRYNVVQPAEVLEFYRDLTRDHGFVMETAGSLAEGRRIWALARTPAESRIHGNDVVRGYLLLATSFDGSLATSARFTSVRVVCNNTLSIATDGKAEVSVSHSTAFDADRAKFELNIGPAWEAFTALSEQLASRPVSTQEQGNFLLDLFFNIKNNDELGEAVEKEPGVQVKIERLLKRFQAILTEAPGNDLISAKNTAWGLVNAVTYDVDYSTRSRSNDTRLNSAWFGTGEQIKRRALQLAQSSLLQAA